MLFRKKSEDQNVLMPTPTVTHKRIPTIKLALSGVLGLFVLSTVLSCFYTIEQGYLPQTMLPNQSIPVIK